MYKVQQDFQVLMHTVNPPLKIVKKFIHLLSLTHHDFNEQLRLQKYKVGFDLLFVISVLGVSCRSFAERRCESHKGEQ